LVARSKRLYIFRQACHATEVLYGSKTGPDLAGILNRQVAILEDSIHSGTLRGMGAAMPGLRAAWPMAISGQYQLLLRAGAWTLSRRPLPHFSFRPGSRWI